MNDFNVFRNDNDNGYILRMKKDISIPKLQKLCKDITSQLVNNGFWGSDANFVVTVDDIQIVVFIREYNGDLLGAVGFKCEQIDDDGDCLELHPYRGIVTNEIFKEWTEDEWDILCSTVRQHIIGNLCS